jgi:hypothetical protein
LEGILRNFDEAVVEKISFRHSEGRGVRFWAYSFERVVGGLK